MLERHVAMQGYVDVLRTPGLRVPLLATVIGALPLGMLGLSLLLYAHERTGSLAVGGLATAAFGLGNAVGLSAQGRLIDRYGQPKVVAAAGLACAILGIFLVTAAPLVDWRGFVVVAGAGMGAGIPATTGSMRVLLAELVREGEARTAGYALLAVLFQLAVLTGPLLTSLLLVAAGPEEAVLAGGFLACGAALLFAGTRASRTWRPLRGSVSRGGARTGKGLAVLLLLMAGAGVSAGAVAVAVPAAALSLGSAADSGMLIATSSAGQIIAGLAFGAVSWRWSHARLMLVALAGSALAVGLAAWAANSLALLFPALFLVGLCGGPSAIASSALLDTLAPRSALTRAYTLMVSVWLLGDAVGNAVSGVVAGSLGHRPTLALGACWLAALFVVGTLLRRALDPGPGPAASGRSEERGPARAG
ncbi:MFS transporter [Streptomyces johnsoniae]|uniref:MFS transporter n=1 Tax=Streptomyces johnsoniae TaxID=3075532 RepID=A0ABU2S948_9ACTN|nr:MFS transporter [Streptomyces sp. DSM 41886]MDT0444329.1 MFS transporter [Streptomyces sp. DSM 41886]